jgi:hypothetical protein
MRASRLNRDQNISQLVPIRLNQLDQIADAFLPRLSLRERRAAEAKQKQCSCRKGALVPIPKYLGITQLSGRRIDFAVWQNCVLDPSRHSRTGSRSTFQRVSNMR